MDDYGYFGKGATGYAHYNQAFQRNFGDDDNGGGSGKDGGCLAIMMVIIVTPFIITL